MIPRGIDDRVRELVERRVPADEVRQVLERPVGEGEREEVLSLARWFRRRYPTGAARLAYIRRAYARYTAAGPKPEINGR